ncbi:hypothetical protein [Nocardioides ferulae]|uniref:hypothetical protein n=1 Tax=Nocardioides ferulae TaxID=2340821 RepID=UPI000F884153|nr:hypothetical protein [Nocardioides ferulae]
MSDPEAMYAAMTSGSAATIAAVDDDVVRTMRRVSDSIALIRYAEDKPIWESPTARTRFNMRAWATKAAAEVGFIRLNRAALALQRAEADYRAMVDAADTIIAAWRRHQATVTSPMMLLLFRAAVIVALQSARADYGARLAESLDFVVSDPLTDEQEDWYEQGLAKSMVDDLANPGSQGPLIPETLATGNDDDGWKAQGLAYAPSDSQHSGPGRPDERPPLLVQTSYAGGSSQLSLIDPGTGQLIQTVELGNIAEMDHPPDHAGGVVVHNGTVWVTSSDKDDPRMVPYSLDDIRSASPGAAVPTAGPSAPVAAGSYATVHGDTMYVGDFGSSQMYTHTWNHRTESWGAPQGPFPTPPQTQGVAVHEGEIVFSTSYGRGNGSQLQSYPLDQVTGGGALGEPIRSVDLPNMSEGVAALPSGLLTTYESGAAEYSEPTKDAPLESLWAAMHMTVTPYSELGLDGNVAVEPTTLADASKYFAEVQDDLDEAEGRIAGITLPAGALGDVPTAALFATGVNQHLRTTATWLDKGKLSAGVTVSGLVTSAEEYLESDDQSGGLFDRLLSWLW